MPCGGERDKSPPEEAQRWEFITLSDFKSKSAWTLLAYIWLWAMAFVGVAVYAVDTFTAVNLLVFDKWSSQVKPKVPIKYSKWIFAVCILLSWALCFYEFFRAIRVIRRGGVAESYMDPLAVSLQSMRAKGWRRFLVFTELTKSKKGVDYIAFFVYFAFDGAIRIILAEGPRQAVNAMTLYAAMNADLINGESKQGNAIIRFFQNVQLLANHQQRQTIILFSMAFTLVIWVFSALSLIAALLLYLTFLWHYIPQKDGRLSVYCRRKIDSRLFKIVEHKIKAAMEEDERKRRALEEKAELKRKKTGEPGPLTSKPSAPSIVRQPTLPQLESPEVSKDDEPQQSRLERRDTSATVASLPRYESRPPTQNGENSQMQRRPTLPYLDDERPPMPSRMMTQSSAYSQASYESDAPLLANAGYAGHMADGGRNSPGPSMPPPAFSRQASEATSRRPLLGRTMTQSTQNMQRSFTPLSRMDSQTSMSAVSRIDTNGSEQRPYSPANGNRAPPGQRFPVRSNTGFSFDTDPRTGTPGPQDPYGPLSGQPPRQNTPHSFQPQINRQASPASSSSRAMYGSLHSQQNSFSRPMTAPRRPSHASFFNQPFAPVAEPDSASSENSYEMQPQIPPYKSATPVSSEGGSYKAFNPSIFAATPTPRPPSSTSGLQPPKRSLTVAKPANATDSYFSLTAPQRSATAPIDPRHTTGYDDIISSYDADQLTPSDPEGARSTSISPPPLNRGTYASSVYSDDWRRPSMTPLAEPMPPLNVMRERAAVESMPAPSVGVPSSVYASGDAVLGTPRGQSPEDMHHLPPQPGFRANGGNGRTDSWERGPENIF